MTFASLANAHAGQPAVVIGKGPTLDAWIAAGCPQPAGAVRIGVNHVGGAVACDYNVSVHSDHPEMDAIPGVWLRGIAHGWDLPFAKTKWQLPNGGHWMLTGSGIPLLTDRAVVADCRWFYCASSSAQPAIQLAWYLGCPELMLVGIDGGKQQAKAAVAVPGGQSPAQDYSCMTQGTHHVADTLFGPRWRHWAPPAVSSASSFVVPPSGGSESGPAAAEPRSEPGTTVPKPMKTRDELAQQLFQGHGAELGVAKGAFARVIKDASNTYSLYCIDRWSDHHDLNEYHAVARAFAASNSNDLDSARVIVLRMTFAEACPLFPAEHFDFLYIDGYAHTGQEGGQTLRDWWPKLKPGGIFAGHDYHPTFQPTIDAVDAFVREHGLELNLTTEDALPSWWVVKP